MAQALLSFDQAVTRMGVVSPVERIQVKTGHEQMPRRPEEIRRGACTVPSPWSYGSIRLPASTCAIAGRSASRALKPQGPQRLLGLRHQDVTECQGADLSLQFLPGPTAAA